MSHPIIGRPFVCTRDDTEHGVEYVRLADYREVQNLVDDLSLGLWHRRPSGPAPQKTFPAVDHQPLVLALSPHEKKSYK